MTAVRTVESDALKHVAETIQAVTGSLSNSDNAKLELLEMVSCLYSGFKYEDYCRILGIMPAFNFADEIVEIVVSSIQESGISYSFALSALSRIEENPADNKRRGSYYSDFRLASYLASKIPIEALCGKIIDPACGTGILLVACALRVGTVRDNLDEYIGNNLYGIDLSPLARRGCLLSLASLLHSSDALSLLSRHLICDDSLDLSLDIPNRFGINGFNCVIGNPPWERVRPSKYEFLRADDKSIGYGERLPESIEGYSAFRKKEINRAALLSDGFNIKGGVDLYHAFFNLACGICSNGGSVYLYLPAGVIRSKGQAQTRQKMFDMFERVAIDVFNNRAKFFSIDSRFKFILARLDKKGSVNTNAVSAGAELSHCSANSCRVLQRNAVTMPIKYFRDASGELGVPEVKTEQELRVLEKMWASGRRMSNHPVFSLCKPMRELDMTLDKNKFRHGFMEDDGFVPLIEGRMVSQYRFNAKRYVQGEGRSAKWSVTPYGLTEIEPQYYVDKSVVAQQKLDRLMDIRVGYCDIVGQTNERAMQAALIPRGVFCGNKVPTVSFQKESDAQLWMGIVNSFAFDWILRRYITTTVNHFILQNLPFPLLQEKGDKVSEIVNSVSAINLLSQRNEEWTASDYWAYACLRSVIDWDVFCLYGIEADDLETVFSDFPLVDRLNLNPCGQRPTFELIKYQAGLGEVHLREAKKCFDINCNRPYCPNEYLRQLRRGVTHEQ